jgi:uncharacterized protein (DUF1015 family)
MADVMPFAALRPRDALAARVIAPPYDVLSEAEARAIAKEPLSFVHVTRSEVDLPEGTDSHSEAAYAKAAENLATFCKDGTLVADPEPTFYLYGQVMGDHRQIGVIAACSVPEYDANLVRKHEFTRPDKEEDRAHHMEVLDAQVGLVFLAHKPHAGLAAIVAEASTAAPKWRVTTDDGVEHALWALPPSSVPAIRAAFAEIPVLYIADGHHRSAAASRVHARRKTAASGWFVAGIYPSDNLQVMAYNRVVKDNHGLTDAAFLAKVQEKFDVGPAASPVPTRRGTYTMRFHGQWWSLVPRPGVVNEADPVARLDVSVLQDHLLAPVLGIDDPRRSKRIEFIGGIRGHQELEKYCNEGAFVAFHLFPTAMEQLFDVADAGQVMPPKSTWFEPKLREGVVIRSLTT